MNSFMQYTFAIIAIIFTFLLTAISLPSIIDLWQDWIADQRRRLKDKH